MVSTELVSRVLWIPSEGLCRSGARRVSAKIREIPAAPARNVPAAKVPNHCPPRARAPPPKQSGARPSIAAEGNPTVQYYTRIFIVVSIFIGFALCTNPYPVRSIFGFQCADLPARLGDPTFPGNGYPVYYTVYHMHTCGYMDKTRRVTYVT